MEKVLVTGGAGYIGSHVVKELLRKDYEVVVYDSLVEGHREFVPEGVGFVEGCLSDEMLLDKTFSENNFDSVMHFAAFTSVEESVRNPKKFHDNNVMNGMNLLNACLRHNVMRFIFSSSAGVYGIPENLPVEEDCDKNPVNPYGETKLVFEKLLESYDKSCGLKSVSLRYFNASGADDSLEIGEDHKPETHLIPLVLDAASGRRENIHVFGTDYNTHDGTCIRDYVHVSDLADVHILALENLLERECFNVGVGKGFSVKEVIDMCKKITGKYIKVIETERRLGDPAELYADSSKLKKEFGWEPKHDLKDIVQSAWDWHKKRFE